jgi:adenylosuccinate lyase
VIVDVLAARYASGELVRLWSPEHKVVLERELWLAVLRAQTDLGVRVEQRVLDDYQRVVSTVDLVSIAQRERVTRHDVKARIEEFNALAGHQEIHKGLTSRDITEKRRAASGAALAGACARPLCRAARQVGGSRRRVHRPGDGRAQP